MKIAPAISSSVVGPLGVMHLPRLWYKILLHSVDALPEGYRHGVGGFDEALFVNLGIDGPAFVAFVETDKPTYIACEAWVKSHAKNLTPEAIFWHNVHIQRGEMGEEMAVQRRTNAGVPDVTSRHAVTLNNLDDWATAHALVLEHANV